LLRESGTGEIQNRDRLSRNYNALTTRPPGHTSPCTVMNTVIITVVVVVVVAATRHRRSVDLGLLVPEGSVKSAVGRFVCTPLLFSGLRRFVLLARRAWAAGDANVCTTGIGLIISTNSENKLIGL